MKSGKNRQPPASKRSRRVVSVDDITRRNVETIVKLEEAEREDRTMGDRIANVIAKFCGSMVFVWTHVIWFSGWIISNAVPGLPHFDPFPFTFLTLVVSLEAIFLSTFIMISQNQETRLTERRNHLDLQINLLSEQENTKMLQLLTAIAQAVGADPGDKKEVEAMGQATCPENLVSQIDQAIKGTKQVKERSGG